MAQISGVRNLGFKRDNNHRDVEQDRVPSAVEAGVSSTRAQVLSRGRFRLRYGNTISPGLGLPWGTSALQ